MDRNSPLDFLLLENNSSDSLFGETDTNEVFLPEPSEGDETFGASDEAGETPGDEALEHSDEPRDIISDLLRELSGLKEKITGKLKDKFPENSDPEAAEALDDATSAIDLATHHLEDVDNKLSGEKSETSPEQELEDGAELSPEMPSPDEVENISNHTSLGEAKINPIDNAEPLSQTGAEAGSYDPHRDLDTQMGIDQVSAFSDKLSPTQKKVIQAYLVHGDAWTLIAAELKVNVARAKLLFSHAVENLGKISKRDISLRKHGLPGA